MPCCLVEVGVNKETPASLSAQRSHRGTRHCLKWVTDSAAPAPRRLARAEEGPAPHTGYTCNQTCCFPGSGPWSTSLPLLSDSLRQK